MVGHSSGGGGILSSLSTGIGNFSVGYNFNSIAIALIIMSATVCTTDDNNCKDGDQSEWVQSSESAVVFVGAIAGQLTMGYAGDVFGRGPALAVTLGIACLGALFSSILPMGSAFSIYLTIIFCRFMLGVGLGGVYPLSAAKAAEDFGSANKVNVIAAGWTFMFQCPGIFSPWLIAVFMSYSPTISSNSMWRLLLGLGSIPAAIVVALLVLELRMKAETKAISLLENSIPSDNPQPIPAASSSGSQAIRNGSSSSSAGAQSPWELLKQREVQIKMIVTGGCWFVYDVCTYGVLLFSGEILTDMLPSTDDVSAKANFRRVATLNVIASICGWPFSFLTIYALTKYSVKTVQEVGFAFIAVAFIALIIAMKTLTSKSSTGVFVFYVLLSCALTGGASMTTFVMPSILYPMHVRTTLNGISAACGKFGAVVGAYLFGALASATSFSTVMSICVVLAVIAMAITHYLVADEVTDPMRPTDVSTVEIDINTIRNSRLSSVEHLKRNGETDMEL